MLELRYIRIKTLVIFLLLVFATLIVAASWYYRDDIFRTLYDPGKPFQTYTPPRELNYATKESWLMHPDMAVDPISISGGDVFVVAPTIYLGGNHWVAPTDDPKVLSNFKRIALPNYILPYQSAGRVFSPLYRQASLYSFLNNREDAHIAQRFAYADVKRAFEVFLKNNPPERPIVLVGHGQGGLHVQRLLAEYFTDARSQKLAVAYIIGHPMPLNRFETEFPNLHACQGVEDINCIIAFSAFQPNESTRARLFVNKTLVWDNEQLTPVDGHALLCTNPLLWTTKTDYAPSRLHLGGVAAEGLGVDILPAPSPMQTGAQCEDGILLIDKPKQKSLRRPSRFGGKYRTLSSNLFYEDLRMDAARRVQTLIDENILPRRAPLLDLQTIEIKEAPITEPLKKMKK